MLDGSSPSRLSSLHSCGCMHASRRSLAGLVDRLVSCLLRLCLVTVVVARFNLCSLSVVLAHLSFIHPRFHSARTNVTVAIELLLEIQGVGDHNQYEREGHHYTMALLAHLLLSCLVTALISDPIFTIRSETLQSET